MLVSGRVIPKPEFFGDFGVDSLILFTTIWGDQPADKGRDEICPDESIVFFVSASVVDIYFALIFGCGNGKTVAFLNSQVVQDHIVQAVQGPEQLRRTGGRNLPF